MNRSPSAFAVSAFAAHGFGEPETRRAFHVERRGVKLHELDIADLRARAVAMATPSPVATAGWWYSGRRSPARRGEQHAARADRNAGHGLWRRGRTRRRSHRPAADRWRPHSCETSRWKQAACGKSVRASSCPGESPCALQHPVAAVRAFARDASLGSPRSNSAPQSMTADRRGPSSTSVAPPRVAEAISRAQRVALMAVRPRHRRSKRRQTAPAHIGGGFPEAVLRHHSTWPASASSMAARNPATPAPMTRKSGFIRYCDDLAVGPLVAPAILCVPLTGSPARRLGLSSFALRARR